MIEWFKRLVSGKPHFVVGSVDRPYLLRWFLVPRNRWFNVYLHKFMRDDDDRALHDHPWASVSICIRGGYHEQTPDGERWYRVGSVKFRSAEYRHRIIVSRSGKPAWTIFCTGPRVRNWGFWCPKGFVPWRQFVDTRNHGEVGPGCGDEVAS